MKRFGSLWKWILLPLTILYGMAIWFRNLCWQMGWFRVGRVPVPVVSVGNLTAGGTGKTPVTAWLATCLIKRQVKVGLVSRGYGRKTSGLVLVSNGNSVLVTAGEGGDEPVELARSIPGLLVAVSEKRLVAARYLCEQFAPDVIIMDDGFQHRGLHRDLDIVVQDEPSWQGNRFLLPSGPFREPLSALKRAHWLVWTRTPGDQWPSFDRPEPVQQALFVQHPAVFTDWHTGKEWYPSSLSSKRLAAIAGIGNPDQFFQSLLQVQVPIVLTKALPDHEPYSSDVKSTIVEWARHAGCDALVMTAKDAVKWSPSDLPTGLMGMTVIARVVPNPSLAIMEEAVLRLIRPS